MGVSRWNHLRKPKEPGRSAKNRWTNPKKELSKRYRTNGILPKPRKYIPNKLKANEIKTTSPIKKNP